MSHSSAIEFESLSFSYGSKAIIQNFNLTLDSGKIYCLIGSSGCGKTTVLRLANGLLKPSAGQVRLQGVTLDYAQSVKARRKMGYSFQGSDLFPHMTLYENLTIIARKEGWTKGRIRRRVEELCSLMSLPSHEEFLKKKPRQLSGGQQQRVGIARALFMEPQIVLMDEPFSALDPITRSELQKEFIELQKKLNLTILLVTHDLSEAFSIADEIILLREGKIEQQGKPSHFLLKPQTDYVSEFIHSHSPGNILKEIFLYSVVNTQVWAARQSLDSFTVINKDSLEIHHFKNQSEVFDFIKSQGQSFLYWENAKGEFLSFEDSSHIKHQHKLLATDDILTGMKRLLETKKKSLPVVNKKDELIGVFSQEALDAL